MKRIHVVGVAARTGTTLMAELINSCFRVGGYCPHEMTIFRKPSTTVDLLVTKAPTEAKEVIPVLRHDPALYIVCMMRDPRDVVVSKHGKRPDVYWTNLRYWKESVDAAVYESEQNNNYILVRYEELVQDPDSIQKMLMEKMPFLEKVANFSDFHNTAKPSQDSLDAMKGFRPISSSSVGSWRKHKARLLAQLQLHGDIDDYLINLGYETDTEWKSELVDVTPNNLKSSKPEFEKAGALKHIQNKISFQSKVLRYRLGLLRSQEIKTFS